MSRTAPTLTVAAIDRLVVVIARARTALSKLQRGLAAAQYRASLLSYDLDCRARGVEPWPGRHEPAEMP